jgi:hypothetical protein
MKHCKYDLFFIVLITLDLVKWILQCFVMMWLITQCSSRGVNLVDVLQTSTAQMDKFGNSVSISGDTIVVGAPQNKVTTNNGAIASGAAYVFVREGPNWTQQAYLQPSNPGTNDYFGQSVSISGDTIVVGAHQEGSSATGVNGDQSNNAAPVSGAAYVFVRDGTTWSQQAYLKASNTGAGDYFGRWVSISGDTIVVGSPREDSNATGVNGDDSNEATDSGAAYVYVRNGTSWSQQAYLKASNTEAGDLFGYAVSISGDTIVVGASQEDKPESGSGAAYERR